MDTDPSIANLGSYSNEDGNKKLVKAASNPKDCKMTPLNISNGWYKDKGWRITFNYKETIKNLSGFSSLVFGNDLTDITKLKNRIQTTNWVGELNYVVTGKIYDGFGMDGLNTEHHLFASNVAGNYYSSKGVPDYPSTKPNDTVLADKVTFLKRWDNDPPSIGVQLISQNDKRKWDIQLIEGVNDRRSFAKTDADLAPSNLVITSYELIDAKENKLTGPDVRKEPGCTNFYDTGTGYDNPKEQSKTAPKEDSYKVTTSGKASIKFRKSARLLINVDIFDNCGFKPLTEAWITVKGEGLNFEQKISLEPSHDEKKGGNLVSKFQKQPRGAYSLDLPANGNSITVTVFAKDHQGNKRELTIPVTLVDSTFDARVIENKEQKQ